MEELKKQIKLFIAEKLITWAFRICPEDDKDGLRLKGMIAVYFKLSSLIKHANNPKR